MEFDRTTTIGLFVAVIALGAIALIVTPMQTSTVLMMVAPSVLVFGGICLFLGVKHGEYRARGV